MATPHRYQRPRHRPYRHQSSSRHHVAEHGANLDDISQTIMNGIFTMTMMVTLNEDVSPFNEVQSALAEDAKELGVQVTMQRADVFRMMHEV